MGVRSRTMQRFIKMSNTKGREGKKGTGEVGGGGVILPAAKNHIRQKWISASTGTRVSEDLIYSGLMS